MGTKFDIKKFHEKVIESGVLPLALLEKKINGWIDGKQVNHKILQLLLDEFFGNLKVSKYAKIVKTSTDTALRDLQDLVKKDVLEQEGSGRNTF